MRKPQETNYYSSVSWGTGYAPIPYASTKECDNNLCEISQCCDKVCSSYNNCPRHYELVHHADIVVYDHCGCTKNRCCVNDGETIDLDVA